jgi:hypothetical protein
MTFVGGPQSRRRSYLKIHEAKSPAGCEVRHPTRGSSTPTHLSLDHASANRISRLERVWVFGGCSESTVTISNPFLASASRDSKGKLGVAIMTSGYLDPTRCRLSFSTRAAGKYEFFVRSVAYAFFDPIASQRAGALISD